MSTSEIILKYFRGRADHVAVADDGKTFRPVKLNDPLKPEWLESEHLGGKRCLGFYLMQEDNRVWCSCVDFDSKPENPDPLWRDKAEAVYYFLANVGLSPVVEISQSGSAAHVWLFFSEATEAWIVRAFWQAVSVKLDVPFVEIYPRQDRLTGKGMGNLVRYPLWNQSHFVDAEKDFERINPEEAFENIQTTDGPNLKLLSWSWGGGELKPEVEVVEGGRLPARVQSRIDNRNSLFSRRWHGDMDGMQDQSRSALAQSICCELVRTYVPTPEIEQALRVWCEEHGYEKGKRDDWIQSTVRKAYDFVLRRTEQKSTSAGTIQDAALSYVQKLKTGKQLVIPSGIAELDKSIDGVSPGEMAVIAARPSHGKTAFAMQWIDNAAKDGISCLLISEEMSKAEIGKRALLSITDLAEEHWGTSTSKLEEDICDHYEPRQEVHLVESVNNIDRCEEIIDQYCSVYGVKLVAVDYLQLLGSRNAKRYETVTEISQRLKQAATRNECALLALCQLNRSVENRDGNIPKLSDLRESGQIEQDADLVLMLQWPLRMNPQHSDPSEYRIFCAKRRNGPIRETFVTTKFNPSRQQFGYTLQDFRENEFNAALDELNEESFDPWE